MSHTTEAQRWMRELARDGYIVEQGRRHYAVRNAAGAFLTSVSCTPSSGSWRKKAEAALRRAERRP